MLCLAAPAALADVPRSDSETSTLYINKFFELRDHDAPTKFVFNGATRVARITGSLSTNLRVQHLRVSTGWNLCSLAVTATNSLSQLSTLNPQPIQAAYKWTSAISNWLSVIDSETLPAGTVLWLYCTTNATLSITGPYSNPTDRTIAAPGDFVASAGLEIWDLSSAISNQPFAGGWTYAAQDLGWISWLPPPLAAPTNTPLFVAPGQATFVGIDAPAQIAAPDSTLRIRYYHQDHLGSSSCLSDSQGELVEETLLYPFGDSRHEVEPRGVHENYKFSQKELDDEIGLHYFEARYLRAGLGRFISVDGIALAPSSRILSTPQVLNSYAYVVSNPLNLADPTGNDPPTIGPAPGARNWLVTHRDVAVREGNMREAAATDFVLAGLDLVSIVFPDRAPPGGIHRLHRPTIEDFVEVASLVLLRRAGGGPTTTAIARTAAPGRAALEPLRGETGARGPAALESPLAPFERPPAILENVTVTSRGRVTYRGNVDLRPTLEGIESGVISGKVFRNQYGSSRSVTDSQLAPLPSRPQGYYREYVHPTPGESGPGSQRIVTGAGGERYYTPDHYRSWVRF